MGFIVHRYIHAVRRVQARVRGFIHCKEAKLIVLEKIWHKLEVQYIRKKLAQKKARMRDLQAAKRSNEQQLSEIDSKTFIEMKQQAQLWSKIDGRVEEKVHLLKVTGVIQEESEEEIIARLLAPPEMRLKSCKQYLDKMVSVESMLTYPTRSLINRCQCVLFFCFNIRREKNFFLFNEMLCASKSSWMRYVGMCLD
jgi:hypothetical protein